MRVLDKYVESESDLSSKSKFSLSGGIGFSKAVDKYAVSEFDLPSVLGFSRHLNKHAECELQSGPVELAGD